MVNGPRHPGINFRIAWALLFKQAAGRGTMQISPLSIII
jgi:hypothetical protein